MRVASWWGSGSMLDWTNPAAGNYWHDRKRQPLVEMGILGHWADLGEPEDFSPDARYHGFPRLGLHAHRESTTSERTSAATGGAHSMAT